MSDKQDDQFYAMRHSLAHILASAVQHLWPDAKFGVGPVVENGFYYDIDLSGEQGETRKDKKSEDRLSEEDFERIKAEMQAIIKADEPFERFEMSVDEALMWAVDNGQPYKQELLNDLKRAGTTVAKDLDAAELGLEVGADGDSKVENVSFYRNGDFSDLCRGPHVESTGKVGAFKLMRVSGAYWRGSEKNAQMQRVYGVAFPTDKELRQHLAMLEEAKKRDHRKLGQELDLFTFSDLVGPGLPLYTPRGTVLIEELKNALKEISRRYDMQPVSIPHIGKIDLYKTSGHADKFSEELFHVTSHYAQQFVMKPVNCPHHTQIYAARPRSYKELPLRYIEQTMQYRDEKPGQIGGLQRTRGFTVDDGHTFCRVDQIQEEASMVVEVIKGFYENLGLWGGHWVSLSVREAGAQDKYIGVPEDWDEAEAMLERVSKAYKLDAKRMEGEAAIYGPKLDFMFKDALGRETQLATIQLDFAMPKRFELTYTDEKGENQTPVIIHRAILGSFERFIMLLIEHFAGNRKQNQMTGQDIVVIGASAGGVEAIMQVIRPLPAGFPASIFIVLHIASDAPSLMPEILTSAGLLPALHPQDMQAIEKGKIYLAPPDHHLLINANQIELSHSAKVNHSRPSIDTLFFSAAEAYGKRVIGVVLTGMLDDGSDGLAEIKHQGGIAIVQDPTEALFPYMPRNAIKATDCDYILSLSEIGAKLIHLVAAPVAYEL